MTPQQKAAVVWGAMVAFRRDFEHLYTRLSTESGMNFDERMTLEHVTGALWSLNRIPGKSDDLAQVVDGTIALALRFLREMIAKHAECHAWWTQELLEAGYLPQVK